MSKKPEILAPAGDIASFLAALAAGADAVYVGLKNFSARMQAENFSISELARMTELARREDRRLFIAFNTLLKSSDIESAGRLIARLARDVQPHALIIQEPGLMPLARQAGFEGELYLSTLANVTHPAGLIAAKKAGADRVIVPRELSIDEIKTLATACPEGLELEVFTHGALCYCVSGRCYWSSYMGGKSGLRGRCVQPCRRMYQQGKRKERFFSCLDLSVDVLAKTLLDIPQIAAWKLEGRKKGPHYVYHVVTAYRLFRDHPNESRVRKEAEGILEMALGRAPTKARFLPQRANAPTAPDGQTSSGRLIGKVQLTNNKQPCFKPYIPLLAHDLIRVGTEDESWHKVLPINRAVPKAGSLTLSVAKHLTPRMGTPVFLIDRRGSELEALRREWQSRLEKMPAPKSRDVNFLPTMPATRLGRNRPDIRVRSSVPMGRETRRSRSSVPGIWLSGRASREVSRTVTPHMSWWLPPVIWPDEEAGIGRMIRELLQKGAKYFVCNAPWQVALFEGARDVDLIAGPFCNAANAFTLQVFADMGFNAAFVSPELARADFLELPKLSPLPLGVVIEGFWPMGIARHKPVGLKPQEVFKSPKGELFWTRNYGQHLWIYPAWPLDLTSHRAELESAGYGFFASLEENVPASLPSTERPGLFNWEGELL